MDYFDSISLSKLESMIEKENDAAIKLKLLVIWHKKKGATEREIEEILLEMSIDMSDSFNINM